jgi:hypothetical protein
MNYIFNTEDYLAAENLAAVEKADPEIREHLARNEAGNSVFFNRHFAKTTATKIREKAELGKKLTKKETEESWLTDDSAEGVFSLFDASENPKKFAAISELIAKISAERGLDFSETEPILANDFSRKTTKNGASYMAWIVYKNGLDVNIIYAENADQKKARAIGFKLSEGMREPETFAKNGFKFASMTGKAGTIRGTYFVIKGDYAAEIAAIRAL